MSTPQTTIVVPTIRETCIREFLAGWRDEFRNTHVIVVEDNPERSFDLGDAGNVTHYCWEDIDAELGEASWIVPRRTDCVRSYGYYKAWQDRGDMIVTLDDDCFPTAAGADGFLARHWQRLQQGGCEPAWTETGIGPRTRGFPYFHSERRRPGILNHGLWLNVPDYDAPTQLLQARVPDTFTFDDQTIPVGRYFPMCGMNLAFRPQAVPALYFMLMGRDYAYDRFGDIWAGVFFKRIADHLGWAVTSGQPAVDHRRASNVWANLRKEAPGLEINEHLWSAVDAVRLTGDNFADCYREVADALVELPHDVDYFASLHRAMYVWAGLFDGDRSRRRLRSYSLQPAAAGSV